MSCPLTPDQLKLLSRVATSATPADAVLPWLAVRTRHPDAELLTALGLWRFEGESLVLTEAGAKVLRILN